MGGNADQRLFGPRLEPVDGASRDQAGELQSSRPELLANGREAEDNVEVGLHPLEEPGHRVLRGRLHLGALPLHHRHQLRHDLALFVSCEEVGDETSCKDVVDVLQETLLFDVLICEQEGCSFSLDATRSEQDLQILDKVCRVVSSGHRDLEGLVSRDEGGEFCQTLLSTASHPDQHGVAPWVSDDPRYLDQVDDRVREEDQVHVGAPEDVVVLLQEDLQPLLDALEVLDGFVDLGKLHVSVLHLLTGWLRCVPHEVNEVLVVLGQQG